MDIVIIVKTLLLNSGAAWVLWLLGVLSVMSLAISIERLYFMRKRSTNLGQLATDIEAHLSMGRRKEALTILERSATTAAAIARAGLNVCDYGRNAAEQAMLGRMALEREQMSKRLVFLGTVGNNAPFVGLFGTVVGIVQAFEQLGASAAVPQAGQLASAAVMSCLAEALVATAVGIFVAIPAVAAYNYFQRRIASILASSEVLSRLVLAFLDEGVGQACRSHPGSVSVEGVPVRTLAIADESQTQTLASKAR